MTILKSKHHGVLIYLSIGVSVLLSATEVSTQINLQKNFLDTESKLYEKLSNCLFNINRWTDKGGIGSLDVIIIGNSTVST